MVPFKEMAGGVGEEKKCSSVTFNILSLDVLLPLYFIASYFSHFLGAFCKTKPSKSPSTEVQTAFRYVFYSFKSWRLFF